MEDLPFSDGSGEWSRGLRVLGPLTPKEKKALAVLLPAMALIVIVATVIRLIF